MDKILTDFLPLGFLIGAYGTMSIVLLTEILRTLRKMQKILNNLSKSKINK